MKIDKQKKQILILSGLLVVLAFTMYRWFSGAAGPSATAPAASPNLPQEQALDLKDLYLKKNPRRNNLKKEVSFRDIDPSIHIDKLEDFDPGTPLNIRNMFSTEAVRESTVTAKNSKPGRPGPTVSSASGSQQSLVISRPTPPPTVIINLKFFGTKTDLRYKSRQGFFADGDEVYLASEGDLVANRYRILRIGDSSAEVEELSSKTRRQISLQ
jgi:hypothetical protein